MTLASFAVPGRPRRHHDVVGVLSRDRRVGVRRCPADGQDPRGQRTDSGYTDDVVIAEASLGVSLDLHEIGCPGETTGTMINGGDTCYSPPDSQLNEAVAFLQSHHDERGIVTIDLGFNDVRTCLADLGTFYLLRQPEDCPSSIPN